MNSPHSVVSFARFAVVVAFVTCSAVVRGSVAQPNNCATDLTRTEPANVHSPAQDTLKALEEAARDFQIHVFNKRIGNQDKLLVLVAPLNETAKTHLPKLLVHFQNTGLLGTRPRNSWGDRVNAALFIPIARKLGIKSLPQQWRLAKWLSRLYGQYEPANVINRSDIPISVLNRTDPLIDLQKTHRPSLIENVDSVGTYIVWGLGIALYAVMAHIPHGFVVPSDVILSVISMNRLASHAAITSPRFKMTAWYRYFFPLGIAIMNRRSRTVVSNIRLALESQDPNISEMIAVVSPSQAERISSILRQQDYRPLSLPH